jgi:hypothetical protein
MATKRRKRRRRRTWERMRCAVLKMGSRSDPEHTVIAESVGLARTVYTIYGI